MSVSRLIRADLRVRKLRSGPRRLPWRVTSSPASPMCLARSSAINQCTPMVHSNRSRSFGCTTLSTACSYNDRESFSVLTRRCTRMDSRFTARLLLGRCRTVSCAPPNFAGMQGVQGSIGFEHAVHMHVECLHRDSGPRTRHLPRHDFAANFGEEHVDPVRPFLEFVLVCWIVLHHRRKFEAKFFVSQVVPQVVQSQK